MDLSFLLEVRPLLMICRPTMVSTKCSTLDLYPRCLNKRHLRLVSIALNSSRLICSPIVPPFGFQVHPHRTRQRQSLGFSEFLSRWKWGTPSVGLLSSISVPLADTKWNSFRTKVNCRCSFWEVDLKGKEALILGRSSLPDISLGPPGLSRFIIWETVRWGIRPNA
jgi:hypothetical protein